MIQNSENNHCFNLGNWVPFYYYSVLDWTVKGSISYLPEKQNAYGQYSYHAPFSLFNFLINLKWYKIEKINNCLDRRILTNREYYFEDNIFAIGVIRFNLIIKC